MDSVAVVFLKGEALSPEAVRDFERRLRDLGRDPLFFSVPGSPSLRHAEGAVGGGREPGEIIQWAKEEGVDLLLVGDPGLSGEEWGEVGPYLVSRRWTCLLGARPGGPIEILLLRPLTAALFSLLLTDPLPPLLFLSGRCLAKVAHGSLLKRLGRYAAPWQILLEAALQGEQVLEIPLSTPSAPEDAPPSVRRILKAALNEVVERAPQWVERSKGPLMALPVTKVPEGRGEALGYDFRTPQERFLRGFNHYTPLLRRLSPEVFEGLQRAREEGGFRLHPELWARAFFELLISFEDPAPFSQGDVLNALAVLFYGHLATVRHDLVRWRDGMGEGAASAFLEHLTREEIRVFRRHVQGFSSQWRRRRPEPPPLLSYREFVPGVEMIYPHRVGRLALDKIFKDLQERRQEHFWRFTKEVLGLPEGSSPERILGVFGELLRETERELGKVLGGDLSREEGVREFLEGMFEAFPKGRVWSLREEVCRGVLGQHPPRRLYSSFETLRNYSPRALLALAERVELRGYWEEVKNALREGLRPRDFAEQETEVVISPALGMVDVGLVGRLSGVMALRPLVGGFGGEYPRIRFLLVAGWGQVELERFGGLWRWASRRKEFGDSVIKALEGHWGRNPLSGYGLFEALVHGELLERIGKMARSLPARTRELLMALVEGYPLCHQFPDGRFVTFCAWSWSGHSFRGGKGYPGPLASSVESWLFARDFLREVVREARIGWSKTEEELYETYVEGRAPENFVERLFPECKDLRDVKPRGPVYIEGPKARRLSRHPENPILSPIKDHPWESLFVFNPAAVRLNGRVFLLYRAMGEEWVSRIGLAELDPEGLRVKERLPEPIFRPEEPWEELGCEDPRVVVMEGRLWMLYTAYSRAVAQIALASIDVDDFLAGRWSKWERHGLLFPGVANKDAVLFPEKIKGRYVLLHRVEPAIWVSTAEALTCPWPEREHRILIGPRSGDIWDSWKVGAGAQPLKTPFGWLLIYHGVDHRSVYRLGSLLVDLEDPSKVLYRSPNPILEPEEPYERGEEGCQVPNVVFTCGALPREPKEVLEPQDEILVYYGAADTTIAVASGKVEDIVPWGPGIAKWRE